MRMSSTWGSKSTSDRNIIERIDVSSDMRFVPMLTIGLFALGVHTQARQAFSQQTPTPSPQKSDISVDAKLVVVPAVVRDKHNALVPTLKQTDFALTIDGKPQTIRYFDHDTDVPLTVGLLIDTSMSQRKVLDDERTASSAFLDKMLAPNRDKAFIVQFAHQVELLQDVTDSRPKLQKALKEVDSEKPSFAQNGGGNGGDNGDDRHDRGRGGMQGMGTALYDSVFLASDEIVGKQKGRSALILLTDGDDRGSKESLASAIESAQHANTIVYAIYYKGESFGGGYGGGFPGGGGGHRGGRFPFAAEGDGQMGGGRGGGYQIDGKKVLERMCGETGGRVFEVKGKETVDAIYTQIAEELRAQYRLGFTPTAEGASEGYHQITLALAGAEAKNKDTVQTRDGYYTVAGK
jgi:VWFA-related protein